MSAYATRLCFDYSPKKIPPFLWLYEGVIDKVRRIQCEEVIQRRGETDPERRKLKPLCAGELEAGRMSDCRI